VDWTGLDSDGDWGLGVIGRDRLVAELFVVKFDLVCEGGGEALAGGSGVSAPHCTGKII